MVDRSVEIYQEPGKGCRVADSRRVRKPERRFPRDSSRRRERNGREVCLWPVKLQPGLNCEITRSYSKARHCNIVQQHFRRLKGVIRLCSAGTRRHSAPSRVEPRRAAPRRDLACLRNSGIILKAPPGRAASFCNGSRHELFNPPLSPRCPGNDLRIPAFPGPQGTTRHFVGHSDPSISLPTDRCVDRP